MFPFSASSLEAFTAMLRRGAPGSSLVDPSGIGPNRANLQPALNGTLVGITG